MHRPSSTLHCANDEPFSSSRGEDGECLFLPAGFPVVACKNQCTPGVVWCHTVSKITPARARAATADPEEYPVGIEGGCKCVEMDPEELESRERSCCIS